MKLVDLLKEIGDATARPYDWSQTADEEDFKQYLFQTDSDLKYELEISVSEGDKELDSAVVAFGIVEAGEEDYFTDYDKVPSKGELYKVMATTVSILKDFIKKNKQIKYIYFTTNKLGNDTSKDRSSRLGLYTKYIQKHIPNAKIDTKVVDGQESTMIKLKEVGEATSRPYDWRKTANEEEHKKYMFQTDSGLNYQLDIEIKEQDEERDTAAVSFGVVKPNEDDDYFKDYDETPNKGELYRVMATVVGILKDFIKKNKGIKYLHFTTNKVGPGETKRLGLYKQYIQKHLPNADIETKNRYGAEVTTITLKEIGDASAKVYQWDKTYDDENERIYGFFSDSDEVYNVVIDEIEPEDPYYYKGSDPVSKMKRISVRFYVVGEDPDDEDYEKVVNKGELFKVMATVVDILKFELKLRPYIKAIEFKPSKRKTQDRARLELYKRFFKNFYPNTEFKNYGDEVIAILNKDKK